MNPGPFKFLSPLTLTPLASQVVCVIFSIVSLRSHVTYLPFYKPVVNIANIVHSGLFASATLFLLCAYMRGVPEVCTMGCYQLETA